MDEVPCVWISVYCCRGWLESIDEYSWPCEALLTFPDVVLLELGSHPFECFNSIHAPHCSCISSCSCVSVCLCPKLLCVLSCPRISNCSSVPVSPIVPASPIVPLSSWPPTFYRRFAENTSAYCSTDAEMIGIMVTFFVTLAAPIVVT